MWIGVICIMRLTKVLKNESGTTMILMVLAITALIGMCAIVGDVGIVYLERQRMQNAMDAATLAAAQELPNITSARTVAEEYLRENDVDPSETTITFSDSNKTINIKAAKEVEYFFAKVLGFERINIGGDASASLGTMSGPFDYVLFSGSTSASLIINGANSDIQGSSHTNSSFICNGSKIKITGACEASNTITVNGGSNQIALRVPNAPFVAMPDFTQTIKQQAQQCNQVYNQSKVYNGNTVVSGSIYVNGEINVNSSSFAGTGCVLAKTSIVFNGSSLYQNSGDSICFYSETGNIIVNGSNSEIHGIVYAPKGTVIFNGANQTVYGRVIANNVIFNGSGINVIGGTDDLKSLPSSGVRLTK